MNKEIITFENLEMVAKTVFEEVKKIKEGKNANYIPFLDEIDPELFGLSIVVHDGRTISLGDVDYVFGVESVSKVFTAILALKQSGAQKVLRNIGADATGLPFNSIMAILLENSHPSTPLVNSGAIATVSMIEPVGDSEAKWEQIVNIFNDLCASEVKLLKDLYESETETNFNNRSIAWLLKRFDRIYDEPEIALDLYTRQCSLGVTTEQLAIAAATIAFGGVNPVSKEEVFPKELAPKTTSLMATVGFYEHTGNWMFESGIPAKTGVGGGIMGVVPGQFGIAAFSPRLDASGNSVRAQAVIKRIADALDINIYDSKKIEIE
ncbi:MAG: glutaminase A [Rikenellaceae bacterium]